MTLNDLERHNGRYYRYLPNSVECSSFGSQLNLRQINCKLEPHYLRHNVARECSSWQCMIDGDILRRYQEQVR